MKFSILIFTLFFAYAQAQIVTIGPCPIVVPKTDFDMTKFTGKWYITENYPIANAALVTKCRTVEIAAVANSPTYSITHKDTNPTTNIEASFKGTITLNKTPTLGKVSINYTPMFFTADTYQILGTDYTNYAVVYHCKSFLFFSIRSVWILTRARSPASTVLTSAYSTMDASFLDKKPLTKVDNANCPLFF